MLAKDRTDSTCELWFSLAVFYKGEKAPRTPAMTTLKCFLQTAVKIAQNREPILGRHTHKGMDQVFSG